MVSLENQTENSSTQTETTIGLALSGGGSRAVAFHLGCMKALNELGLLDRIDVISSVSGGSLIAAMYVYSSGAFEEFEENVLNLLRRGLFWSILIECLKPWNLLQSLLAFIFSAIPGMFLDLSREIISLILQIFHLATPKTRDLLFQIQNPSGRFFNRTGAFEKVLERELFPNMKINSQRRNGVSIVINATELATGTAFRFGNVESGSWRFGTIENNRVKVSRAVAASAAYPFFLPSIDTRLVFLDKGKRKTKRIILSDGGIVDNLGTSCFNPSRQSQISTNVYHPGVIISCDAGQGQFDVSSKPTWWVPRVNQAYLASFRKLQDAGKNDLFQWKNSGAISRFVLAMLGQKDDKLMRDLEIHRLPNDFVKRSNVKDYPTDFNAMSDKDMHLLISRGQSIMTLLVNQYLQK